MGYCEGAPVGEKLEALRKSHLVVLAEVAPDDVAAAAELVLHFNRLNDFLNTAPSGQRDRDYDGSYRKVKCGARRS